MMNMSLTSSNRKSDEITNYYCAKKCCAIYSGSNDLELLLATKWRDRSTACRRNAIDHPLRIYVYQRYPFTPSIHKLLTK